jgi:hypothetical protein
MEHNEQLIGRTAKQLKLDISRTTDPVRRAILIEFLKIRETQDLDRLDMDGQSDDSNDPLEDDPKIRAILKDQQKSLDKLERLKKIKAYEQLLNDNLKEKDMNEIERRRGEGERKWGTVGTMGKLNPEYKKYMEEDGMNNKLMERLNSEIDFRLSGDNRTIISKPFDNEGMNDQTDTFAPFEGGGGAKVKYVSKSKLGERKNLY